MPGRQASGREQHRPMAGVTSAAGEAEAGAVFVDWDDLPLSALNRPQGDGRANPLPQREQLTVPIRPLASQNEDVLAGGQRAGDQTDRDGGPSRSSGDIAASGVRALGVLSTVVPIFLYV